MDSTRRIFLETTVKENMDRYYEEYLKCFEYVDYCIDDKTDIIFFNEDTIINGDELILKLSSEYIGYIGTAKFTLESFSKAYFEPHARFQDLDRREYLFMLNEILDYIDEHFIHGSISSIGGHF